MHFMNTATKYVVVHLLQMWFTSHATSDSYSYLCAGEFGATFATNMPDWTSGKSCIWLCRDSTSPECRLSILMPTYLNTTQIEEQTETYQQPHRVPQTKKRKQTETKTEEIRKFNHSLHLWFRGPCLLLLLATSARKSFALSIGMANDMPGPVVIVLMPITSPSWTNAALSYNWLQWPPFKKTTPQFPPKRVIQKGSLSSGASWNGQWQRCQLLVWDMTSWCR